MHRSTALCASLLAVVTGAASAAAPNFKEGEWGTRYRMELVGAPFPMPPITVNRTTCLDGKRYVPDASQQGQDCKITDQKVSGNTVTWTMRCQAREGTIEGHGKVTYKGDRYDGSMDATMVSSGNPGQPVRYRYTMEGQRLGACNK